MADEPPDGQRLRAVGSSRSTRSGALSTLKSYEALCTATILADAADQLAILGAVMPDSYEKRSDAGKIVAGEIGHLLENQQKLDDKYDKLMGDRRGSAATKPQAKADADHASRELRNAAHTFTRNIKQNPLTSDNMTKLQIDRSFLEKIVVLCVAELFDHSTFHTLVEHVKGEKSKKQKLQETIIQEEEGRKRIKSLQSQLVDIKKERESEIQRRNEMIAHLKDQLQEMKAKTSMEKKYVRKCADVSVSQTQKQVNMSEKELRDEIQSLTKQIDDEMRAHAEISQYLKTHQTALEQQVDSWMEKYEKDVERKQHELDVLKTSKAKDLERLQELSKLYAEYEQVVVEERIEKEKQRRKQEQEAINLKAAIRIQSWWRGVMVRRGFGAFAKKKKGKKGKKSGKKKKKK